MSRLERLKELRRKNRMKATACGLALALAIGSAQGLGTYALFTDTEDVASNLTISTGDVDVEVSTRKNYYYTYPNIDSNKTIDMPIEITNNGTLNQNIKLYITEDIQYDFINFKSNNKTITFDKGVMYGEDGNLFVLAPGKSITGITRITLDNAQNIQYGEKSVTVNVKATQINQYNSLSENGFYDIAIQENIITIPKIEILLNNQAYFYGKIQGRFNSFYIPIEIKGDINIDDLKISAELIDNSNVGVTNFKYEIGDGLDKSLKYLIITEETKLDFNTKGNFTLNLSISTKETEYILLKESYLVMKQSNGNVNEPNYGKVQYITLSKSLLNNEELYERENSDNIENLNSWVLDKPKEEIENIGESQVIEASSEEVEQPSESEVSEPPKEEMTEMPKQPEVIEPPKENEGIQE